MTNPPSKVDHREPCLAPRGSGSRPNYIVYVLFSLKDRMLYIGYTTDLERRLGEHMRGESASTAPRRPLRFLFCEHYISKEDATRREKYFKTTAGKRALKLMLKDSLQRAASWPTPSDEQP